MTKKSSSNKQLSVFLIGAQKCGTTTLAALLNQHPDICLTTPKETDYFSNCYSEGIDWYHNHFSVQDAPVKLDASPSYTMASISQLSGSSTGTSVPERIRDYDSDARFIYILRNHADRVYSAYWHNVRGGDEPLDLRDAFLDSDEYLAPTLYCQQLDHFYKFFSKNQFLIMDFEDLRRDAAGTAGKCIKFLGLTDDTDFSVDNPKNQSFQYTRTGQIIRNLAGTRDHMKFLTRIAKAVVPASYWTRIRAVAAKPVPTLGDEDRKWLDSFFEEDRERLQQEFKTHFGQNVNSQS